MQLVDFKSQTQCKCIHTGYKPEGLNRKLKMTHIDFAILNSHVTVIYLRFIKITILSGKIKKNKIAVFFHVIYPVSKINENLTFQLENLTFQNLF